MLLIGRKANAQIITTCCERSRACGVLPGMTLAHARALVPNGSNAEVLTPPHEPAQDITALKALAHWAIRFSPLVTPDPPDGLLLNVTGCARLYGSEPRLLKLLHTAFTRLRFRVRLACAPTIGGARAVARYGEQPNAIIQPGEERDALGPLPIECLRLDPEIIRGLHEVNIDRVDHLLAIPRRELTARFDRHLLRRLDQALGRVTEIIEPIRPPEPMIVERVFDGPVRKLEAILLAARELIDALSRCLLEDEAGAMHLRLTLKRSDVSPLALELRLSHPSRDAKHLWSLLGPKVENANLGFGVEEITLRVLQSRRLEHDQTESPCGSNVQQIKQLNHAAGTLIDTLSHRLGPDRTLILRASESHRPERVAERRTAMDGGMQAPAMGELTPDDRPSILLAQPERIDVMAMTPDGPPYWLRWRGIAHELMSAHGPQRIAGEWWRALVRSGEDRATRDYYRVQDGNGRWLWIYRSVRTNRKAASGGSSGGSSGAASGGWFLHGFWT